MPNKQKSCGQEMVQRRRRRHGGRSVDERITRLRAILVQKDLRQPQPARCYTIPEQVKLKWPTLLQLFTAATRMKIFMAMSRKRERRNGDASWMHRHSSIYRSPPSKPSTHWPNFPRKAFLSAQGARQIFKKFKITLAAPSILHY